MTVRDMHLEIDQSTQLVAANRSRRWYPEEKDWVLNKMLDRYIRGKLKPKKDQQGNITGGFELDQVGTDDIRTLLKTNVALTPYIADAERYKCILPADYAYLISDGSRSKKICDGADTPTLGSDTLFITRQKQTYTTKGSAKYYETITVTMPDGSVVVPTDLPYGHAYVGYESKADVSFIRKWILSQKPNWYWERFDDLYYPGHYVQVQKTTPGTPALIMDGTTTHNYTTITRVLTYHTDSGTLVNNRLSATDTIRNLNQVSFFRTSHFSPISELQNNVLWIYRDASLIVSEVQISYIRKPQPIDLSLNSDCELPESMHQSLCDLAIEYMQGRSKDVSGVQLSEADLAKRVII